MLVRRRMARDPVTVTPDDTLAHALALTREHRIRHLPVVLASTQRVAGVLSDRDIRLAMPSPLSVPDAQRAEFLERTPVASVMTREVVTVSAFDTVEDAARLMCKHRIGSLLVVDENERLTGIVTETDILHAFVQILGGTEPASRIEVELKDRPGELARAMRVIGEQEELNIVSIVVPSDRAAEVKTATLHLGTIDPRAVIDALEGAGFRVGWPSLEADQRAGGAR